MIGALWNGMSGIISYEKGLNVEANNAANISTVGHKKDTISFEDALYSSRFGKGVNTQGISKTFEQGNIRPTQSNIDVAIDGKGFFIVKDDGGKTFYTRAGNFIQAEDGFLKTQNNLNVMGIIPQQKKIVSTDASDTIFTDEFIRNLNSSTISFDSVAYNINAKSSDYYKSAKSDDISLSGSNYKTSGSKINDVETALYDYNEKLQLLKSNPEANSVPSSSQITQINYSKVLNELQNENNFISVSIDNHVLRQQFDTDIETTLKKLSDKISNLQGFSSSVDANTGIFTIERLVNGKEFKVYDAIVNDARTKSEVDTTNLQLAQSGSGMAMLESSRDALKKALENADAKFLEITNILTYSELAGYDSSAINTRLDALTLVKDTKGDISIEDDGFVFVKVDGNSFLVGRIGTASFKNETGLLAIGDNLYSETKESGTPINADKTNKMVSKFLENANVNMGDTLSMIMIYQRAYEANSKSITTSDEMLQKAMDMKR